MREEQKIIGGRYLLIRMIGRGGSGTVYLAEDLILKKQWAVKILENRRSESVDEVNVLKKLNHPRLPRIVDVLDEGKRIYIVMDYLKGRSLEQVREERRGFGEKEALQIGICLAGVLQYLHTGSRPVFYGDMKPQNILYRRDGEVMLTDLGAAVDGTQTAGFGCRGTPGYAAPEQYGDSGRIDARSDIYSLGMTIISILLPFPLDEDHSGVDMLPEDEISADLRGILRKCTERKPSRRYQTAEELREALYSCERTRRAGVEAAVRQAVSVILFTVAGILLLFLSAMLGRSEMKRLNIQYSDYLIQAAKADETEPEQYYQKAMDLLPEKDTAYIQYLSYMKDRGKLETGLRIVTDLVGTGGSEALNSCIGEYYFSGDPDTGMGPDYKMAAKYLSKVTAEYDPGAPVLSEAAVLFTEEAGERDDREVFETLMEACRIAEAEPDPLRSVRKMQIIAGVFRTEYRLFRESGIDVVSSAEEILTEALRRTDELQEDRENVAEREKVRRTVCLSLAGLMLIDETSAGYLPEEASKYYLMAAEMTDSEEERRLLHFRAANAAGLGSDASISEESYLDLIQRYPEAESYFTYSVWLLDHEETAEAVRYFREGKSCPGAEQCPQYEILTRRLKGAGMGWNS